MWTIAGLITGFIGTIGTGLLYLHTRGPAPDYPNPISVYRIGWGTATQFATRMRYLIPCLIRGRQPDGQRVPRHAYLITIATNAHTMLWRNRRHLIHRPWQAECGSHHRARRGLTPKAAITRLYRDCYRHHPDRVSP